jgi:hypothetical protein
VRCSVCKEDVLFELCACGDITERRILMAEQAATEARALLHQLEHVEKSLELEKAARAYLGGDKSKASVARLTGALSEWVKQRSEHG